MRRLILPGLFAVVAFAMLVSLGNWQIHRLAWKEDLIARATERPSMEAVDLRREDLANLGDATALLEEYEYRRARLTGEYVPSGEVLVFTSLDEPKGPLGGPGHWVLTPFRTLPGNALVYVNRGFVPAEGRPAYAPPPAGELTIEGLIRAPEPGNRFTPDPDLANRTFYARNVRQIAEATGEAEPVGFFLDLDASQTPASGLPQSGETRMAFTNNHLQYAVTWYGLAAALLAVFTAFAWRTFRGSDDKHA